MQVQFTATFDEYVDATARVVKRIRRRNQRARLVGWAVLTVAAGLVGAFIPVDRPNWAFGLLVAGISGVCLGLMVFPIESRLRAWVKQTVGSEAPFDVVVELSPAGISFKQMNTHTLHEWAIVEEIEEDEGDVIFHVKNGQIMVVRARAFETPEARRRFVETANQLRALPITR